MSKFWVCGLIPILAIGCATAQVPAADRIRRITVSRHDSGFPEVDERVPLPRTPTIEDRDQIERIARFLGAHKRGWRHPWDVWSSDYYYELETDDGPPYRLGSAGNLLFGDRGPWGPIMPLSEVDMRELHDLLDIPAE
jgi:hypothetical protein